MSINFSVKQKIILKCLFDVWELDCHFVNNNGIFDVYCEGRVLNAGKIYQFCRHFLLEFPVNLS